jgi:N-acetylglucosamine kinase-like BadF-type ATPase
MCKAPRLYLGFDAGGTKTHAVIVDRTGHVRGVGRAGPGNWEIVGLEGAYRALAQALHEALTSAALDVADLGAAGYGLAGLDWPSDEERLTPVIERLGVPGPAVWRAGSSVRAANCCSSPSSSRCEPARHGFGL